MSRQWRKDPMDYCLDFLSPRSGSTIPPLTMRQRCPSTRSPIAKALRWLKLQSRVALQPWKKVRWQSSSLETRLSPTSCDPWWRSASRTFSTREPSGPPWSPRYSQTFSRLSTWLPVVRWWWWPKRLDWTWRPFGIASVPVPETVLSGKPEVQWSCRYIELMVSYLS